MEFVPLGPESGIKAPGATVADSAKYPRLPRCAPPTGHGTVALREPF